MATGNFYREDAERYYVVLAPQEIEKVDEEGIPTGDMELLYPDEWEIDEFIGMVQENFKEKCEKAEFNFDEFNGLEDNNRNFFVKPLGTVSKYKEYNGFTLEISAAIGIRSGYYEAANLDYKLNVTFENYDIEIDGINKELFNDFEVYETTGFNVIHSANAQSWAETALEELKEFVEKVLAENSNPYEVEARFSNGETIYKKVEVEA